jgi:nitrogenase molybdenum-iron protein alpha/beta subunit
LLAALYNIPFFETSAYSGVNVETAFTELAAITYQKIKNEMVNTEREEIESGSSSARETQRGKTVRLGLRSLETQVKHQLSCCM